MAERNESSEEKGQEEELEEEREGDRGVMDDERGFASLPKIRPIKTIAVRDGTGGYKNIPDIPVREEEE